MRNFQHAIAILILIFGLSVRVHAGQDPATKVHVLTRTDLSRESAETSRTRDLNPKDFIREADLKTNMMTILGNLAQKRSRNNDVKEFAQKLTNAQSGWYDRLHKLAAARAIPLPNEMSQAEIKLTDHLTEIVDLDFD